MRYIYNTASSRCVRGVAAIGGALRDSPRRDIFKVMSITMSPAGGAGKMPHPSPPAAIM